MPRQSAKLSCQHTIFQGAANCRKEEKRQIKCLFCPSQIGNDGVDSKSQAITKYIILYAYFALYFQCMLHISDDNCAATIL